MNRKSTPPKLLNEPPFIWLTEEQRAQLRAASQLKQSFVKPNERLELVIAQIMAQNPNAFLTDEDLPLRKFFNAPQLPIPYQSAVM